MVKAWLPSSIICDPNCEADENKGRVWIIAIRDIEAGEELTYDYNLYDGDLDDPSPCSCGTPDCRGSMYSEKELGRRAKALRRRSMKKKDRSGEEIQNLTIRAVIGQVEPVYETPSSPSTSWRHSSRRPKL